MSATFDHLAEVLDRIANTSSRNRKLGVLADWLSALPDADLERGARFLCGKPVAGTGDRKLSIGHSILCEAAVAATGLTIELFRLCHREVGDTSETIALLMEGKSAGESLSLAEAEQAYLRLFAERKTALKVELLRGMLERMRPKTTKYFLKVITGNFRIGMQQKLVEDALARATGAKLAEVRDAANRTGDLAQVARAARAGMLATLEMKLFHPLEFMLARPLDDVEDLVEPESWWVEDKYDGIRSQVHTDGGKVRIFTRGMEDTTAAFPDVVEALAGLPGSAVVDGELLAWREGRALNFTVLQQRLARKKVDAALIEKVPVVFVAYDLLYRDGALLLDAAIETRRQKLESLFAGVGLPLMVSRQWRLSSREVLEETFTGARERGNEGLLLKKTGSLYESAKRSAEWLKVKRPYGTLDVVVTAAEQGSGRRATLLSDYTFAVKDGERFLNVGKAYSGLTDDEIRELTRLLRSISKERFGRVALVEPKVVLEVAFDGVQKSPRHKSGYALRFPRIVRWRKDKEASEIDELELVRELYERSLA